MARFRPVGCRAARRIKVEKQLHVVHEETYDVPVVDVDDPTVQFVAKLQKGVKLFKEIAGDSDTVSTKCMFCIRLARCGPSRAMLSTCYGCAWNRNTIPCELFRQLCTVMYLRYRASLGCIG